jgi:hypothetical protein
MTDATTEQLMNRLTYARRQKAFAWAKYYEAMNDTLREDHIHYNQYNNIVSNEAIPAHIKTELKEMATALKKKWECPICMNMIEDGDLEISNCGHYYCKPCLAQLKQTQKDAGKPKWECAVCRRKHGYRDEE